MKETRITKHSRILGILTLAVIFALLVVAMPGTPVLAQTLSCTPTFGTVGTTVTVSGSGFIPSHYIRIEFTGIPRAYGTVSSGGTFSATFTVPKVAAGTYQIQTIDLNTSLVAAVTYFALISAKITIEPEEGPVGTEVKIDGERFVSGENTVVEYDGDEVDIQSGDDRTDGYGEFEDTIIIIPQSTAGDHTITVTGDDSGLEAKAVFTVEEQLTIDPAEGRLGTELAINGTGFGDKSDVTVYFDGNEVAEDETDRYGSFTVTFSVPALDPGTYNVEAKDKDGNTDEVDFTLLVANISLNPPTGNVGTELTVTGTGFTGTVTIKYDGVQAAITTAATGAFSAIFNVPASTVGAHTVTASGDVSTANAGFTVITDVSLSQTAGYAGDEVTVSGTGFGANQSLTITFVDSQVKITTTDATGSFSDKFTVLPLATGTYTVVASDDVNTATADFEVLVITGVSLSQTAGYAGDEVTVSGTGFGANQSLTITFAGSRVKTTTTDAIGSFSDKFTVPASVTGTHTVVATDNVTTVIVDFEVLVTVSLSQTTGNVGTEITVSGIGFSGVVTIKYASVRVAIATAATGAFSATFSVPVSTSGAHTITVSDDTNIVQKTFTMESETPPAPVPLLPEVDSRVKSEAYFDWEDVSDPSGVTYTLQIASDENFTEDSIVLEREGLTESEYNLTKEERLESTEKEAPYYWRVKAVDGASNESEWSTPVSFHVGFPLALPQWAIYTLIAVGAVVVGFIGFWLFRRTTYSH